VGVDGDDGFFRDIRIVVQEGLGLERGFGEENGD